MIDGYLMTCGGRNRTGNKKNKRYQALLILTPLFISGSSDSCFSLEKGTWVKKPNMTIGRNGLGASPYPGTPNSLMVSKDKSTEFLLPGESWQRGPNFQSSNLYLHCQATLGSTIIITGRYLSNIVTS